MPTPRTVALAVALALVALLAVVPTANAMTPESSATPPVSHPAASVDRATETVVAPTHIAPSPLDPAHGRAALTGPLARFPHPGPAPVAAPSYYGHYYAGTVYSGANFTSHQLSATIQVPLDVAQGTDFYYVILSVWDDASSYDQVGIANAGGAFGIAYSTTDYCANQYYYSPYAAGLSPGVTYNFSMTIAQGEVTFLVADMNGSVVWSLLQTTGGAVFVESAFYSCFYAPFGNVTAFYDYTDYEEVYQTNGNVPPYDFFFGQNLADGLPVTSWGLFTTPPLPGAITVPMNGDNAVVANEPFSLYLNQLNATYALVSPSVDKTFSVLLGVLNVDGSGPVTLGTYFVPNGWAVTLTAAGGTPPLTFTAQVTVPAGTPEANYTVGFSANDATGDPNQLSVWFQVVPALSVAVHVGPKTFADLGQNITITAVPGGGIGGLAYAWAGLPPGCTGATQSIRCQPTATGVYLIVVTVSDGAGDTGASPIFSLVIFSDPIVSLVASPAATDVNESVTWYASATSGAGGFSYAWVGLFAGCTTAGSIATCVPRAPGDYALHTVVTDAATFSVASTDATVHVLTAPQIVLALSSYTADVGQPVHLTAVASGGGGGFSYSWTGLPGGCASSAPVATCAFSSPGSYLVMVSGLDIYQVTTAVARAYVTVSSDPVVRFSSSSPSVDLGQSTLLNVQVNGGAPGYSYAYANLPEGCNSADTATLSCTPSTISTYANLTVSVTDHNAWTVAASLDLSVYEDPSVTLAITPAQAALGDGVRFVASVSGGAGSEAFDWANLPGGCEAAPSATIACTPSGTGTTTVVVTVTDRNGFVVNASATLTVGPAASPFANLWPYLLIGVVGVAALAVVLLWVRRRRAAPPEE